MSERALRILRRAESIPLVNVIGARQRTRERTCRLRAAARTDIYDVAGVLSSASLMAWLELRGSLTGSLTGISTFTVTQP